MKAALLAFTHAADEAQRWVDELGDELGWNDNHAYCLLRAVLHALRDWMSPDEMVDLASQMPIMVRGIFFEGWRPGDTPAWDRKKQDFIDRVVLEMRGIMPVSEGAITAVFGLLTRHLDVSEIEHVRKSMKKPLRDLWPPV